jgi:zinc protease
VKLFFKVIVFVALFFNVNAAEIDLTKVIPLDPMITHGKLDNGVTYYVKNNQLPKNKAYLELVIKAGSLNENENQRGLAHLLEHMAFNSTKSFPKNKIDEYLRSLGLSLGADFNASTSYERTIYKFQIPTSDEKYLDTGIHILSEIGSELTLEDEAFEREKKIVEEEWRRGLGKFNRIDELQKPYLFKNSKYLERDPIGTMDVIRNFKYETAKEYYRQWYRPELMGVFVVGDIDQKKAEQVIKKYFSSIKAKTPAIEKPLGSVPKYNETIFANITDPEISGLYIQILNREPKLFMETGINYKDYLIRSLTESIFQRRLSRILIEQDSPLISSTVDVSELSEQEEMYSVYAMLKEGQVDEGLKFLLTEIERVKQNGFVEDELELVKKDKLLSLEISLTQKNTTLSVDLLDEYKRHFIDKEMTSGIDYEFELAKQVMKKITLKEINDNFYKYYQPDDRIILFKAPEKYKELITKEKFTYDAVFMQGQTWTNCHKIENIEFKMISVHDFLSNINYMDYMDEFILKYNRRLNRLKNLINSDESIHMIHCLDHQFTDGYIITIDDIINYKKYLCDINSNNNCFLHIVIPPKYNNIDFNNLIQDKVYVYYLIDTQQGSKCWQNTNFNWNIIFDNINNIG